MEITEVRIGFVENNNKLLLASCSITFDDAFVVKDLKIIQGTKDLFLAMPSCKLADHCTWCKKRTICALATVITAEPVLKKIVPLSAPMVGTVFMPTSLIQ
jgi:hypothetical protein